MRNTSIVVLNGIIHHKYHKIADAFEVLNDHRDTVFIPGNRSSDVEIASIHFGFEICLDHGYGILQQRVPLQRRPDIHVACSATVTNNPAHIFARPGGLYLHASSVGENTAVYKVNLDGSKTQLSKTSPEYLDTYSIPNVGGNDNKLQLWGLSLQDRPNYDKSGRTLADVLVAAASTLNPMNSQISGNSWSVAIWLINNAQASSEMDLFDLCRWWTGLTDDKPTIQNIVRLTQFDDLYGRLRYAFYAWFSEVTAPSYMDSSGIKELQHETQRLKKVFAKLSTQNELLRETWGKK
jgi:hypothetical protein